MERPETRTHLERRVSLARSSAMAHGFDSLLVTNEINVSYLSGFAGSDSMLLLTPKQLFFITDSRYAQEAKESLAGFKVCVVTGSAYSTIAELVKENRLRKIGFESMSMPYAVASKLQNTLRALRAAELAASKDIVEDIRAVKDSDEVESIRRSIRLTKTVLLKALGSLRPGVREDSIARAIEIEFLKGCGSSAFDPIVASAANSAKPHAKPGSSRVMKDSFVLIDIGARLCGYCADMTRTVITGKIKNRFAKIYKVVRAAQEKAIQKVRPGARISEVDFAARGYIHSCGYGKYFGHSVGHGVGMEVHEQPTVSRNNESLLKKGMVITIEPAVYMPGFGGVRIEDMVLVTDKGHEILT